LSTTTTTKPVQKSPAISSKYNQSRPPDVTDPITVTSTKHGYASQGRTENRRRAQLSKRATHPIRAKSITAFIKYQQECIEPL